jgi:hypothetical protein
MSVNNLFYPNNTDLFCNTITEKNPGQKTLINPIIKGIYNTTLVDKVITIDANGNLGTNVDNSGINSVSIIGSSPNSNALTITGSTLNVEPASASFGGVLTNSTQSIAGIKTLVNDTNFSQNINLPKSTASTGVIKVNNNRFIHNSSVNVIPDNVAIGVNAGNLTMSGSNNVFAGYESSKNIVGGSSNVCVGALSGQSLTSGSQNLLLGAASGISLPSNALNCIMLNNNGTNTDTNLIKIGTDNLQTKTYISGIKNNTIPDINLPQILLMDPTNSQLASSTSLDYREFLTSATVGLQQGNISAASINGIPITPISGQINTGNTIRCIKIGKKVTIYFPRMSLNGSGVGTNNLIFFNAFTPALPPSFAFQNINCAGMNNNVVVPGTYVFVGNPVTAFNIVFSSKTTGLFGFQSANVIEYLSV